MPILQQNKIRSSRSTLPTGSGSEEPQPTEDPKLHQMLKQMEGEDRKQYHNSRTTDKLKLYSLTNLTKKTKQS